MCKLDKTVLTFTASTRLNGRTAEFSDLLEDFGAGISLLSLVAVAFNLDLDT